MKKLIGFTGYKENGKTTAANYLMQRYLSESETPIKVERINMKDSIVEEMNQNLPGILGFLCFQYETTVEKLFKDKPEGMRRLMQDYGLMRRLERSSYWVDKWMEKVKASNSDVIITDDLRFLNEMEAIQAMGGKIYKVFREGQENTDRHATEKEIDLITGENIIAKDKEELFGKLDLLLL